MRDKLRLLAAVIAADLVLLAVLLWALARGSGRAAARADVAAEAPGGAREAVEPARRRKRRGRGKPWERRGGSAGGRGEHAAGAANPSPKPGDGMVSEKRPNGAKCGADFDDGPGKGSVPRTSWTGSRPGGPRPRSSMGRISWATRTWYGA